jgi:hypothetical protein
MDGGDDIIGGSGFGQGGIRDARYLPAMINSVNWLMGRR